jgi:hypothetical protein
MPRWVINAIGVLSPLVRELRETRYQFDRPFVVDSSAFQSTFGIAPTPIDEALEATLEFYRPRPSRPLRLRPRVGVSRRLVGVG